MAAPTAKKKKQTMPLKKPVYFSMQMEITISDRSLSEEKTIQTKSFVLCDV